jgi:hypothetical protein
MDLNFSGVLINVNEEYARKKVYKFGKNFREAILSEILQYFGTKIVLEKYLDKSSYYKCNL